MFYRIRGWHHGLPINVAREVNGRLLTCDGIVESASKNFQWAVGKPIVKVLIWVEEKGLRWAVADSEEALKRRRGGRPLSRL